MQPLESLRPPAQPQATPDRLSTHCLRWINADDQTGTVRDRAHLHDLLAIIGTTSRWNWVRVCNADDTFAQICGLAATGLIVELSKPGIPDLITRRGAQLWPRVNVGQPGWSYLACRDELLPPGEVIDIITHWFFDGYLDDSRYERRDILDRNARRIDDDEAHE